MGFVSDVSPGMQSRFCQQHGRTSVDFGVKTLLKDLAICECALATRASRLHHPS